ncbi:MAG: hypothetical protein ACO331_16285 [Prochlorothrix sp.]
MLTQVLYESDLKTFKFWFADAIQDGTHYQNELFCRLARYPLRDRAIAYQLSCRLGQRGCSVLLSIGSTDCGLWGALRDPMTHAILVGSTSLTLNSTPLTASPLTSTPTPERVSPQPAEFAEAIALGPSSPPRLHP